MDSPLVQILRDTAEPWVQWLFTIAGVGIGIGVVIQVVRYGWDLFRDMTMDGYGMHDGRRTFGPEDDPWRDYR